MTHCHHPDPFAFRYAEHKRRPLPPSRDRSGDEIWFNPFNVPRRQPINEAVLDQVMRDRFPHVVRLCGRLQTPTLSDGWLGMIRFEYRHAMRQKQAREFSAKNAEEKFQQALHERLAP